MPGRHRKPSRRTPPGRHRRARARSPLAVPAITVVALAAAGGGAAWGLSQGGSAASTGAAGSVHASPYNPLSLLSVSPSPLASPPPPASHPSTHHARRHHAAPDSLRVRIVGDASYLEVRRRSGRLITERILHHHQRAAFRRHGLHVVLGNAGAVRLSVNGHRWHAAGRPGQVRRFTVR